MIALLLQAADTPAFPADWAALAPVPYAAIACPTVEQYAAGLVLGFARGNLAPRPTAPDQWYRATIVFDWRG